MKAVCSSIAGILIVVVFVTTLCAQTCVDPVPATSSCPAHHTRDCCKHEDGSSERARVGTFVIGTHSSPVHVPMQSAHILEFELRIPDAGFERFRSPLPQAPNIGPATAPLVLRI